MSTGHAASPDESVSQGNPVPNHPRVHSRRNHSTPAAALRRHGESTLIRVTPQLNRPSQKATYMPSSTEQGTAMAQGKQPYICAATAIQ